MGAAISRLEEDVRLVVIGIIIIAVGWIVANAIGAVYLGRSAAQVAQSPALPAILAAL